MTFLLALILPLAHASYDPHCMKLLQGDPGDRIQRFYGRMIDAVHSRPIARKLKRERLQPIDYETFYDVISELNLSASFTDGTRITLTGGQHSLALLSRKLETENVIQVTYSPQALERVREVLRGACIAVNPERWCDSYDTYMGLSDNRARVFSRKEEQALKWATIYQTPNTFSTRVMKKQSTSPEDLRIRIERLRNMHLITSTSILRGVFNESNVQEISSRFATKYLNDAYDRMYNMTENNISYFPR